MPVMRFLVADGSPALQTFARQLFESYGAAPADIKTASTPQAALEVAAELQPDFLLTDWFPKEAINGIALHREMLHFNPACRFGLLSADTSPTVAEEAQRAGAQFLLPKPCTAQDLRNALGQAAGQARPEPVAVRVHLPTPPVFKAEDRVRYRGQVETVNYVVLRRGELMVQLHHVLGMVPASKLQKA